MKFRSRVTFAVCLPLLAGLIVPTSAFATMATANPAKEAQTELDSAMVENFGVDSQKMFVMDESKAQIQDGGTVFLMPADAEDALFITPELAADLGLDAGKVQEKRTTSIAKQLLKINASAAQDTSNLPNVGTPAAGLCWTGFYTRPGGSWGPWGNRKCSQIGSKNGKQGYYFQHHFASYAESCGQGSGFVSTYKNGIFNGVKRNNYGLGCGRSGSRVVPWSNVAGYPQLRTKASYLSLGGDGVWA